MLSATIRQNGIVLLGANVMALLLSTVTPVFAQETKTPEISAGELVRETIAHECEAAKDTTRKHMFHSRKQTARGSQTRLYIETNDAMAAMTIAINDQPLKPQQQKAEQDHLAWLANNPEQLHKKRTREKEDEDRTFRILRALPDAFLYEYDGTETGEPGLGKTGDPLKRLKFTPNPSYSPPTRVEQVLAGMQGYLLVDPAARRIARIDGTLFRDITFGWGIIGHLDKGGQFRVQQADVGDGAWELTAMNLKITGKILLFKAISMSSDEKFNGFRAVPSDLSFARGVELLKTEQEKLARQTDAEASGKAER
jgi:hypothetical protein